MNSSRVKTEKKGQQNVSKCNVDWNYAHPLQISKMAPKMYLNLPSLPGVPGGPGSPTNRREKIL